MRPDNTSTKQRHDAVSELNDKMAEWRHEANKHKRTASWGTVTVMACTTLVPVAIVMSQEWSPFWFGKLIPASLAAICSIVAGWLHFRRPSERWILFRSFQECLETDLMLYRHKAGPYHKTHEPARLLIEHLADHERRMQRTLDADLERLAAEALRVDHRRPGEPLGGRTSTAATRRKQQRHAAYVIGKPMVAWRSRAAARRVRCDSVARTFRALTTC
jgi:Protein of unknown function (DUF4231)